MNEAKGWSTKVNKVKRHPRSQQTTSGRVTRYQVRESGSRFGRARGPYPCTKRPVLDPRPKTLFLFIFSFLFSLSIFTLSHLSLETRFKFLEKNEEHLKCSSTPLLKPKNRRCCCRTPLSVGVLPLRK